MLQVLNNLISNAIKFTEHGEIEVSVQRSALSHEWVTITVRDTGIGIARHHIAGLFESFHQVPGVASRDGGTGLGLSICKFLLHAMGAHIRCDSTLGSGTTFTIDGLCVRPCDSNAADATTAMPAMPSPASISRSVCEQLIHDLQPIAMRNASVLILSPRPGSQRMWKVSLESVGCNVAIAATLDQAVEQLANHAHIPFDVLMMDGYDSLVKSCDSHGNPSSSSTQSCKKGAEDDNNCVSMVHRSLEKHIAMLCSLVLVFVSESSRFRKRHDRHGESGIQSLMLELARLHPEEMQITQSPSSGEGAGRTVEVAYANAPRPLLAAELIKPFKITTLLRLVNQQFARFRRAMASSSAATASETSLREFDHNVNEAPEPAELPLSYGPHPSTAAPRHRIPRIATEAPLDILVVEDNSINQRLMTALLKRLGYEDRDVHVVDSAADCLAFLAERGRTPKLGEPEVAAFQCTSGGDERPAAPLMPMCKVVILMDITMHGMDGLECTRRIRANPALSPSGDVPWIIAQTASTATSTHADCLAAGMNDMLSKPLDVQKLAAALRCAYAHK